MGVHHQLHDPGGVRRRLTDGPDTGRHLAPRRDVRVLPDHERDRVLDRRQSLLFPVRGAIRNRVARERGTTRELGGLVVVVQADDVGISQVERRHERRIGGNSPARQQHGEAPCEHTAPYVPQSPVQPRILRLVGHDDPPPEGVEHPRVDGVESRPHRRVGRAQRVHGFLVHRASSTPGRALAHPLVTCPVSGVRFRPPPSSAPTTSSEAI